MHKYIGLLLGTLATAQVSYAQKPAATNDPRTYLVGAKTLELHAYLEDTAKTTTVSLAPGTAAEVVGSWGRNWAVVKKGNFLYYAPAPGLIDFEPALYRGMEQAEKESFPFDASTQRITYQGVVEVPGVSKDELYTRAYEWMAKTYRSANAVIQMHDKEAGRLVGKGATIIASQRTLSANNPSFVRHTLSVYIKEGRYKYVLTDFEYVPELSLSGVPGKGGPLEQETVDVVGGGAKRWEKIRRETKRDAYALTNSLTTAMAPKKGKDASDF